MPSSTKFDCIIVESITVSLYNCPPRDKTYCPTSLMLPCLGSRLLYLRFLKIISLSSINKRRYIKVYSFDRMKSRREKSLDMLKKPTSRSCWLVHAFWYFGIFFWKWKWNENYLKIKSVVKKVSCIYFNIFW